jgi:uncharacterized protein YkwD
MTRLVGLFVFCSVLAVALCYPTESSYSQSTKSPSPTLSKAEQDLLNEINQARANPQLYAGYLEKLKPYFKGKIYDPTGGGGLETQEGWNAVEDAITFLRAAKPLGPLSPSGGLCLAALSHVKDQSKSGATGHSGGDRTMIEDRVKPYGNWQGGIGENLGYGNESAREFLLMWLIDDGFASRGHRVRIMSDSYKVAGISCGPHPQYGSMCVLTLAGGFIDKVTPQPVTNISMKPTNSKTPAANSNTTKPANTSGTKKPRD